VTKSHIKVRVRLDFSLSLIFCYIPIFPNSNFKAELYYKQSCLKSEIEDGRKAGHSFLAHIIRKISNLIKNLSKTKFMLKERTAGITAFFHTFRRDKNDIPHIHVLAPEVFIKDDKTLGKSSRFHSDDLRAFYEQNV